MPHQNNRDDAENYSRESSFLFNLSDSYNFPNDEDGEPAE